MLDQEIQVLPRLLQLVRQGWPNRLFVDRVFLLPSHADASLDRCCSSHRPRQRVKDNCESLAGFVAQWQQRPKNRHHDRERNRICRADRSSPLRTWPAKRRFYNLWYRLSRALIDLSLRVIDAYKLRMGQDLRQRKEIGTVATTDFQYAASIDWRRYQSIQHGFASQVIRVSQSDGMARIGQVIVAAELSH